MPHNRGLARKTVLDRSLSFPVKNEERKYSDVTTRRDAVPPAVRAAYLDHLEESRGARVPLCLEVEVQRGKGVTEVTTTMTVGMTGVFVRTHRAYDLGVPLKLRIATALRRGKLEVSGHVAWFLPGAGIGVRFDAVRGSAKNDLIKLLTATASQK